MNQSKNMELKSILKTPKTEIKGKNVLITGGARGIGLETALCFAEAGANIILTDIDDLALGEALQLLTQYQVDVKTRKVDVASKASVLEFAQAIMEEIDTIDVLINNAGIGHHGALDETTFEKWSNLININVWGPLNHIYAFLPYMKKQGFGHIVNVSSGQAYFRLPSWGAYASTKIMIAAISDVLYFELKKYNVNVTTVYPYVVNTGFYNDVQGNGIGSTLSMILLPFYAQKPEKVAQKIFRSVLKKKRIEMVNVLNSIAKGLHFFNPVSNVVSTFVEKMLNEGNSTEKNDVEIFQKLNVYLEIFKSYAGQKGFKVWEIMSGEHEFKGEDDRGKLPMEFEINWGPKNIVDFLNPFSEAFLKNELEGTISISGLCDKAACTGTLELLYFSERKIRYTIDFEADGARYQFIGEKRNIYPWNLLYTHTCCFGQLIHMDSGEVVSDSITHFYFDTLMDSIKSFEFVN